MSTHCPFQTFAILFSFVVAIANHLLISGFVFPFACILAPRYSKLLTLSISSLSIFITASSLHLPVLMILVYLTCRNKSLQTLFFYFLNSEKTDIPRFSLGALIILRYCATYLNSQIEMRAFSYCKHFVLVFFLNSIIGIDSGNQCLIARLTHP